MTLPDHPTVKDWLIRSSPAESQTRLLELQVQWADEEPIQESVPIQITSPALQAPLNLQTDANGRAPALLNLGTYEISTLGSTIQHIVYPMGLPPSDTGKVCIVGDSDEMTYFITAFPYSADRLAEHSEAQFESASAQTPRPVALRCNLLKALAGQVIDTDGRSIASAQLHLWTGDQVIGEVAAVTSLNGRFYTPRVQHGAWYSIAAPGYASSTPVEVQESSPLTIVLRAAKKSYRCQVLSPLGFPLQDAAVHVTPGGFHNRGFLTRTGPDGIFSWPAGGGASCRLAIQYPGLAPERTRAFPRSGDRLYMKIHMAYGGTLAGTVVDQEGRGLAGVIVSRPSSGPWTNETQTSDESGRYWLQDLPHGSNEIRLSLGESEAQLSVEVHPGNLHHKERTTLSVDKAKTE